MPFPTSPVLDDFNRPNTGPPPSSSWSNRPRISADTGLTGIKVVNNAAVPDGTDHYYACWWNVQAYATATAPVEVWGFIGAYDREYIDLFMHITSPGVDSAMDGYILNFDYSSGTDLLGLFRVDNDNVSLVGATIPLELGAGDGIGMRHDGATFSLYHYDADGGGNPSDWTLLGTRASSTYTSGYLGAGLHLGGNVGSVLSLDSFGGGYVVTSQPFAAIGGFPRVADGRLALTTSTAGASWRAGQVVAPSGALAVTTGASVKWAGGFRRDAGDLLAVAIDTAGSWSGGFLRDAAGALCVTATGPFTWQAGFLRDATGRLAVQLA